jgi:hypothetical protein
MARVNPFSWYPPSFEDAVREILAVGPSPTETARAKPRKKRPPAAKKAKTSNAKKKRAK